MTSSALKSRLEAVDAGVELHALAQVEGDGLAVGGDVPLLGEAGNDGGGAAGELDELVEDGPGGVEGGAGGVEGRGEVLRAAFRAVDQRLGLDRRCAEGEHRQEGGRARGEGPFHRDCSFSSLFQVTRVER